MKFAKKKFIGVVEVYREPIVNVVCRSDPVQKAISCLLANAVAAVLKLCVSIFVYWYYSVFYSPGIYVLDMFVSLLISVVCSLSSHLFYRVVFIRSDLFLMIAANITESVLVDGEQFYILWKNRIMLTTSIVCIIFLLLVPVDSIYLIECIIISLLSSYITQTIEAPKPEQKTRMQSHPLIIQDYTGHGRTK